MKTIRTLALLVCTLALASFFAPCMNAAPTHEVVYSWKLAPANPESPLIQGTDGNLYGTTNEGGQYGFGTVFKMTPAGVRTTLVEFSDNGASNKGANPQAALLQGTDGNFYGTTKSGGASPFGTGAHGTVFKMTPAGVLTTLVEFAGSEGNKGEAPNALMHGSDGNFYSTTTFGGVGDYGTVFKMTPAGVLTTLVDFINYPGSFPAAGLVQGSDGNFYGTTNQGGPANNGTVFKMTPAGALTTLVEFTWNGAINKGFGPSAALVQGTDGNFYGTTQHGGQPTGNGFGTVFKMTPGGVLTTLLAFNGNGATNKGASPQAALVRGTDGKFYGTTSYGSDDGSGFGTVFKMTPAGVLTTLVEFTGNGATNKGANPSSALVQGTDGKFYGPTEQGGASGFGTVFKMTSAGVLTTLVQFTGNDEGSYPEAGVVQGSDGNFYGTTYDGGTRNFEGTTFGTVFKVTPAGVLTKLVNFNGNNGWNPTAALVRGSNGNFYGTTESGGTNLIGGTSRDGTVFKMTPAGVLTKLVDFHGSDGVEPRGLSPLAALTQSTDGNFYGTTNGGGASGHGTVFKMKPVGVLTTLVDFTGDGGTNKGEGPQAGLVQGSDGNFYGTTSLGGAGTFGTVFKMTPAGVLTTLVEFSGPNGDHPYAALVQGSDGNFYGTTYGGGANGRGTVFKMTPAGALTMLVEFTGNGATNKGAGPYAALLQGIDGNFYGTTDSGGAYDSGTLFKMTPGGALTTLFHFAPPPVNRGFHPRAALIKGTDNNFYGTTRDGGSGGGGTVFRLRFGATPVTKAAISVASTSATLKGTVNPHGFSTTVRFHYGISATLAGATTVLDSTIPAGTTAVAVSLPATGLTPSTVYYFRVTAQNAENALVQRGAILSFTTLP